MVYCVIPAKAGIQVVIAAEELGPGLRRGDARMKTKRCRLGPGLRRGDAPMKTNDGDGTPACARATTA